MPKAFERVAELPRTAAGKLDARVARVPRPMIYDNDADLHQLDGKTVAILGYGSQGHAHALNLKDSGVDVVVGLREDSSSVEKAKADGLEVASIADAASRGDVVMVLLPDEKQHDIWESDIRDGIAPGQPAAVRARLLDPLRGDRARRPRSTSA